MIDETELARRRTLMGRGVTSFAAKPDMFGAVTDRSWTIISGASPPDLNMAMIHADDPALLTAPLA